MGLSDHAENILLASSSSEVAELRDDVLTESSSPTSPVYGNLLDIMSHAMHRKLLIVA